MSDLQVILFFLAMPLLPCLVASIMARNKRARLRGRDAVATYEVDGESEIPRAPMVDRRALAKQRYWDLYYKNSGQVPPTGDRRQMNRRREADPRYRDRRRG